MQSREYGEGSSARSGHQGDGPCVNVMRLLTDRVAGLVSVGITLAGHLRDIMTPSARV